MTEIEVDDRIEEVEYDGRVFSHALASNCPSVLELIEPDVRAISLILRPILAVCSFERCIRAIGLLNAALLEQRDQPYSRPLPPC